MKWEHERIAHKKIINIVLDWKFEWILVIDFQIDEFNLKIKMKCNKCTDMNMN